MRRKEGEITADKKLGRVRSEARSHTRVLLSLRGRSQVQYVIQPLSITPTIPANPHPYSNLNPKPSFKLVFKVVKIKVFLLC